jgi:hypothetical protein
VAGRSGAVLSSWLTERDAGWRSLVAVAALDPFRGYASALRTQLPAAVRVLDGFHVVKLGFDAVDQVRRRVQQETFGHRGRAGDPLYSPSAGCCAAGMTTTATGPGPGCCTGSISATPTARWPRPGSPRKSCAALPAA